MTMSSLCRMSEEATPSSSATSTASSSANHQVGPGPPHSDSSDSGCALEEYTWVPHGLRPQQVRHTIEESRLIQRRRNSFISHHNSQNIVAHNSCEWAASINQGISLTRRLRVNSTFCKSLGNFYCAEKQGKTFG